ncbi:uncharacterized protein Gasu_39080 [Galdieria sulphuraria]|uniref:Uncharacterized protein n=1 Tax=Galdieria sulphuraria TaxID=130081 RepID=M2VZE3_GALSU|nr:uncharacterized protein Gasu_39080 [Galdieria sulphuraria]EME28701.1 hypothetical protein Gasu_39080 [Galdieria sulphuraria]|eukprot:XP_005705221.1 hypothetical protein Gasu_39080 [Galdieria sulphuraria]
MNSLEIVTISTQNIPDSQDFQNDDEKRCCNITLDSSLSALTKDLPICFRIWDFFQLPKKMALFRKQQINAK